MVNLYKEYLVNNYSSFIYNAIRISSIQLVLCENIGLNYNLFEEKKRKKKKKERKEKNK